jgi:hypothetical protein
LALKKLRPCPPENRWCHSWNSVFFPEKYQGGKKKSASLSSRRAQGCIKETASLSLRIFEGVT